MRSALAPVDLRPDLCRDPAVGVPRSPRLGAVPLRPAALAAEPGRLRLPSVRPPTAQPAAGTDYESHARMSHVRMLSQSSLGCTRGSPGSRRRPYAAVMDADRPAVPAADRAAARPSTPTPPATPSPGMPSPEPPPTALPGATPSNQTAVRLTAFVRGRVQGVGFRWWARARALELGLAGSVANLSDGRVQVVAEGDRAGCERLLELLQEQPSTALRPGTVTGVTAQWAAPSGAVGFVER